MEGGIVDEEEAWMEQGAHDVCYSCSFSPHPIWCCHEHDCEEGDGRDLAR